MTVSRTRATRRHRTRPLRDRSALRPGRSRRSTIILIGSGVALAAVWLLILVNIGEAPVAEQANDETITELIAPNALDPGDMSDDPLAPGEITAESGWIETSDPATGRLAQRYRFTSLDPNPEHLPAGWMRMRDPRAELFFDDGRVVTISGDAALANAPSRTLESGTITGNVEIRLFQPGDDGRVDLVNDEPALALETPEAIFENTLGEVRCEGEVVISTPEAEMPGRSLWLQFNDVRDEFELRIEEVDYIRIATDRAVARTARTAPRRSIAPAARPGAVRGHVRRAALAQDTTPDSAGDAPTWYLLTLEGPVHARQREVDTVRNVHGDDLTIVFNQSSSSDDTSIARADAKPSPLVRPAPLPMLAARLAIAAIGQGDATATSGVPDPLPGEAVITCAGPLTVVPLSNPSLVPDDADDAVVRLGGAPVTVEDEKLEAIGLGADLVYHTVDRRIEMTGSAAHPLTVRSPRADMRGDRFWLSQDRGTGGLAGAGAMAMRETGAQTETSLPATSDEDPPGLVDLDITWTERMEFELADADAEAASGSLSLRSATFIGGVEVRSEEIALDAGRMTVGFTPDKTGDMTVESIHASEDVDVKAIADSGRMTCETVEMDLRQTDDGKTIPTRLEAAGDVTVIDADQRMWADDLLVTFREAVEQVPPTPQEAGDADAGAEAPTVAAGADPAGADPAGADPAGAESAGAESAGAEQTDDGDPFRSGSVEVHTLHAKGDVQLLMSDGARAFGDTLDADAIAGTAALTGDDVVIVHPNLLIDHGNGTTLTIDRAAGKAIWDSPGKARIFKTPITLDTTDRIERPRVPEEEAPTDMQARWNDRMTYEVAGDDDAGAIVLEGDVEAEMTSTPGEQSTMTGRLLELVFAYVDAPAAAASAPGPGNTDEAATDEEPAEPMGALDGDGRERKIVKLVAEGDAKLENKVETGLPKTPYKFFYVAGERVSFDDRTFEAVVKGPGRLLLHDPVPPAEPERPPRRGEVTPPFSSRGTTQFDFSERLHMTRVDDERLRIVITGDVRVTNRGLDSTTASMTGEHFEVFAMQLPGADAPEQPGESGQQAFDLGGQLELEKIIGRRGVFITTPTREVECGELDYSVKNGMARLAGQPGRVVTVLTRGEKLPYSAEVVEWDMTRDTIRVVNASNTVGR